MKWSEIELEEMIIHIDGKIEELLLNVVKYSEIYNHATLRYALC